MKTPSLLALTAAGALPLGLLMANLGSAEPHAAAEAAPGNQAAA